VAARTRRKPEDIEAEISRATALIFEVEDMSDPTDDDLTRSDEALGQIPTLESELAEAIARADEIQRLREQASNENVTEPGDQRTTPAIQRRRTEGPAVIVKGDEFEILRSSTRHMGEREYRDGLADSIERASERYEMPDGYDDSLRKFVRRHKRDASWSKNILARMDPNYVSAFEKVVTGTDPAFLPDVERAAMAVGTNTAGGHLVPTHLDPTLILTNSGVSNIIRGMSRVVTLTGGANRWNGVTTAGATASWDAELTEVSDDTPSIGPAQIPVYSAKALIMASIEAFEDITGLAGDVQMMLADAKDRHLHRAGLEHQRGDEPDHGCHLDPGGHPERLPDRSGAVARQVHLADEPAVPGFDHGPGHRAGCQLLHRHHPAVHRPAPGPSGARVGRGALDPADHHDRQPPGVR
jgi:hypothetical protein